MAEHAERVAASPRLLKPETARGTQRHEALERRHDYRAFSALLGARPSGPQPIQRVRKPQGNGIFYETDDGKYYRADGSLIDPDPESLYLVGEGDFSLALATARMPENRDRILKATSYETEEAVLQRPAARANVEKLRELDVPVAFNVDATRLGEEPVSPRPVKRLAFVFPHAGGGGGNEQHIQEYIENNEPLLRGFLQSGLQKLKPGGTIGIVLKNTQPYNRIDLEAIADELGYKFVAIRDFHAPLGYKHVQTNSSKRVADTNAQIHVFKKPLEAQEQAPQQEAEGEMAEQQGAGGSG